MKDKIVILTGPTGVGKTEHSLKLAKDIDGEIISCDSFQIYKYMNIGTAKVTEKEKGDIPHHNIDIVSPDEEYNTALFKEETKKLIKKVIEKGRVPILTGGTGLYLHSIIYDLDFSGGESQKDIRKKIEEEVNENGIEKLYDKLLTIDSDIENFVEKNNRHRVMRAYEIYLNTGEKPSIHLDKFRNKEPVYDFLYFIITQNREELYERINKRVDIMLELGLAEEIEWLIDKGYNFDLKSFKAIGYKEFEEYYKGNIKLEEVIEKIKQHSRNYAKRQITWFKRVEDGIWLDKDNYSNSDDFYKNMLNITKEFLNNGRNY